MNINLEDLTYDELIGLNRAIVERLKFLDSMQTQNEMMQFSPGEKVCFQASANRMVIGTLVRIPAYLIISTGFIRSPKSPNA